MQKPSAPPEKTSFSINDVPDNGVAITLDCDKKLNVWMFGDIDDATHKAAIAIYRLMSYHSGDGNKIYNSVVGITGRDN